jgi:hypothetical protein
MSDFQGAGGLIVLTKQPKAPTLYWHQDWMNWNDPLSLTPWPQTMFLSYYLQGLTVSPPPPSLCAVAAIRSLRILRRGARLRTAAYKLFLAATSAALPCTTSFRWDNSCTAFLPLLA